MTACRKEMFAVWYGPRPDDWMVEPGYSEKVPVGRFCRRWGSDSWTLYDLRTERNFSELDSRRMSQAALALVGRVFSSVQEAALAAASAGVELMAVQRSAFFDDAVPEGAFVPVSEVLQ